MGTTTGSVRLRFRLTLLAAISSVLRAWGRLPRRWQRRLIVAAVTVAVLSVGIYHLAGWWHQRMIDERVHNYEALAGKYADEAGLPTDLVLRVIEAESGGDPRAASGRNAYGLMQVTRIAEKDVIGPSAEPGDLFDPDYNLRIGTIYLRRMVDRFDGDLYLALAAYNTGPTRMAKLRKQYPGLSSRDLVDRYAPRETRAYCRRILDGYPARLPPP